MINKLHTHDYHGLPHHKVADEVQEVPVQDVWLLPGVAKDALEVHLLLAVGAGLLLPDDTPPTDAELVENVPTRQLVRLLNNGFRVVEDVDFVAAHGTNIGL